MKTETEITKSILPELSMTAEFVRQDENSLTGDPHKWQVKWVIHFKREGSTLYSTEYFTGIGHIKGDKLTTGNGGYSVDGARAIRRAVAYGDSMKPHPCGLPRATVQQPAIDDVMYCLVSDSDVIDYGTFEEWADNLGYDTDSREAEKTYQICLEQALKLRSAIGNDKLEQLRESFQDY